MTSITRMIRRSIGTVSTAVRFLVATRHKYDCRCDSCRAWWVVMGMDPTSRYDPFGPFTIAEIEQWRRSH